MELKALPDSEKRQWLVDEAKDRGLELPVDVLEYLFARVGRSQADLVDVIEKLDFESLAQSRKLTIPFVREVLKL
jgi:DnaA family protein